MWLCIMGRDHEGEPEEPCLETFRSKQSMINHLKMVHGAADSYFNNPDWMWDEDDPICAKELEEE